MRIGNHERVVVVDQRHPVGPLQAVVNLARAPVRLHAHHGAGAAVAVGVAGGVDHQLVEGSRAEAGQIGERLELPIGALTEEPPPRPSMTTIRASGSQSS